MAGEGLALVTCCAGPLNSEDPGDDDDKEEE